MGNISAAVIEKDFWVCWTLKLLFALDPSPARLIFKGGTSLSKVYGVIQRFSEDIDLSLNREDLGSSENTTHTRRHLGKKAKAAVDEIVAFCRVTIVKRARALQLKESIESVLGPPDGEIEWSLEAATPSIRRPCISNTRRALAQAGREDLVLMSHGPFGSNFARVRSLAGGRP